VHILQVNEMNDEDWSLEDEGAYVGVCATCECAKPTKLFPDEDGQAVSVCKRCWKERKEQVWSGGRMRNVFAASIRVIRSPNFVGLIGCALDGVWLVRRFLHSEDARSSPWNLFAVFGLLLMFVASRSREPLKDGHKQQ
jgi:hypothetical protein